MIEIDGLGSVAPRGLKIYKSKGKLYAYHRKSGVKLNGLRHVEDGRLRADRNFLDELEGLNKPRAAPGPGSLGGLFAMWCLSPDYQRLKVRTRADYQRVMDYLKPGFEHFPLAKLSPAKVIAIRDAAYAARKRRFANYVVSVISSACEWGRLRDHLKANPAAGVPAIARPKDLKPANRPWTREERTLVLGASPTHLVLPITIGAYTGLREGDVLNLPVTAWDGQTFRCQASKNGELLEMSPPPAALVAALDHAQRQRADLAKSKVLPARLCLNAYGDPWGRDGSGFRSSFFKLIRRLEATGAIETGLTSHGLRHSVGAALAEAGKSESEILAMLANRSPSSGKVYTRQARRKTLTAAGVAALDAADEAAEKKR
ncbi:MAG: tyrosine-type recombinase/integrase [Caulobacterales bacterium]